MPQGEPLTVNEAGAKLLDVHDPSKPTVALPAGAREPFQVAFVTVTAAPDWTNEPFQEDTIRWSPPNEKAKRFGLVGNEYRYWYLFPSTFLQMDDYYTSAGSVHPTGVESCFTGGDSWLQPGIDPAVVAEWDEMWRMTMQEDIDAVAIQQPNLRSGLVPHGRLMPSSESAIAHFHRLCFEALRERLA